MLSFLKKIFGSKPAETTQPEAAPYKIEITTPVAVQASEVMIESVAPAKKKPVAKKDAAPKAPRKPRTPKV